MSETTGIAAPPAPGPYAPPAEHLHTPEPMATQAPAFPEQAHPTVAADEPPATDALTEAHTPEAAPAETTPAPAPAPATRPASASRRARRTGTQRGDVVRFTLDLERQQHMALRLFGLTNGVEASRVCRALLFLLETDESLRTRVLAEVFADDTTT